MKFIAMIVMVGIGIFYSLDLRGYENNLSNGEPKQTYSDEDTFSFKGYDIEPLYDYEVKAKVLGIKEYSDRNKDLSQYDFVLGWNEMSDNDVLDTINISQKNRWYFWNTDKLVVPRNKISHQSANTHLIHANESIKEQIEDVDEYDTVLLKGYLVKITSDKDKRYKWKSSVRRDDTGNGACEVFFVKSVEIIED